MAAAKNLKSETTGYCSILVTRFVRFHVVAQSFFVTFAGIYTKPVVKANITSDMDFTKQFQDIAIASQPIATLLRKAVVSVKKDNKLFSPEQLTKIVTLLMGSLSYILF